MWILDGIVISAAEIIENPQGVDDEFVIPEDKSHIEDREQKHITKNQEIRRIIENADEVYTNGQGLFVWVLYEDGKAKIVHGYDHTGLPTDFERIVLSTAYERSEEPREFVERLKESKQLDRIYP